MIVYQLTCSDCGERFEAWFGSIADYDEQRAAGLVECPICQSREINKAPMAPAVARSAEQRPDSGGLAKLQARLLSGSTWVGEGFTDRALAMHAGEEAPQAIHGTANADQARDLIEAGAPVVPLPLPVVPPDQMN